MTLDWSPLQVELRAWQTAGLTFPLWWRDDDAVAPTPQLDRLISLSNRLALPVHLAVIPQAAQSDLSLQLKDAPQLIPVVHGWSHKNHAPSGEKKSEFRLHRPMDTILKDARQGLMRLQSLFGDRLRPMFVPPWNRVSPEIIANLPKIGFRILSTATPRPDRYAAPELEQINTHLDPIDWRGSRGLADPNGLILRTAALLKDRREGRADPDEPFGVLTHHLVHDQQIWTFTEGLLHRLLDGPTHRWIAPQN